MTTTTQETTATACPSWCNVQHDRPGGFHAGPDITDGAHNIARAFQADHPGATAGIVVAGELLTDGQAHELGMALVRAADQLRRARIEAQA